MNQKLKFSTLIVGLLITQTVYAVQLTSLPTFSIQESFFQKIERCKLNIFCYFRPVLGTVVTTISGSTLISAYPAIQNANVNALNDGKIENSSTTINAITTLSNLSTVGTLISGSLGSGFTTVGIARGGTGSTTLSLGQVLVGSSTNAIATPLNSWGASGQLLTSQGINLPPQWTTVSTDPTLNYAWTGNHNFTGTTTIKNLTASSTVANPIYLNGVNYNTPSVQGAANTVLTNNGSGSLTFNLPDWIQRGEVVATTTVTGMEIVNIATSTDMRIILMLPSYGGNLTMNFNHDLGPNGGGQQYRDWQMLNYNYTASTTNNSGGGPLFLNSVATSTSYVIMDINNSSTTQKIINFTIDGFKDGIPDRIIGGASWNDRTHSINAVGLRLATGTMPQGSRMTIYGKKD